MGCPFRVQDSPDFGGEYEAVPVEFRERLPIEAFALTAPVQRRSVKEANAQFVAAADGVNRVSQRLPT